MANRELIAALDRGVASWNELRRTSSTAPDLRGADLSKRELARANLKGAKLAGTKFIGANLYESDLSDSDLRGADLSGANLHEASVNNANLAGAVLRGADCGSADLVSANFEGADLRNLFAPQGDFQFANLQKADLRGAKIFLAQLIAADLTDATLDAESSLSGSNLMGAKLVRLRAEGADFASANLLGADLTEANFTKADLTSAILVSATVANASFSGARVYGLGVWNLSGQARSETDLIITHSQEPAVTVDDLEVAQFIYLLRNNPKIQDVIETVTRKAVLILGRFVPERKTVLDGIRDQLKNENHVGILFDFDPAQSRTLTETVSALAHLSRFIIADLTAPKSVIQELTHIIPELSSVPVQPIQQQDVEGEGWAMFGDLRETGRVLPLYRYADRAQVERELREKILGPVERWLADKRTTRDREQALAERERELAQRERELARREAALRDLEDAH